MKWQNVKLIFRRELRDPAAHHARAEHAEVAFTLIDDAILEHTATVTLTALTAATTYAEVRALANRSSIRRRSG